ncbi:MAG: sulfatase-like hydrolase/transferase [Massilia sp.]
MPTMPRMFTLSRYAVYLVAFFLLFLSYWINRFFGRPDLNQILYHVNIGLEGIKATDPVFIRRFVRWCVLVPLLLLLVTVLTERARWFKALRVPVNKTGFKVRAPALFLASLPVTMLLGAAGLWAYQVSAYSYFAANFGMDYFSANYVPPMLVQITDEHPKNLILVYVESLEQAYTQTPLFGRDLLAPLKRSDAVGFSRFDQAPGTGWTIAGMVGTQCGIPLKRVSVFDENTQGEVLTSFLPNAVCLSDLLAQRGYRNVFMGGGSTAFAGKDKFLHDHHYQEAYGKEDWLGAGVQEGAMNAWGLYDGDLFARAKTRLRALHASHQRFNLTILTVNTHEPEGHLSQRCGEQGYAGFEGVVQCTASDLGQFLDFVKTSGYLADTNVVVMGDHLARKNPVYDKLSEVPERTIFNLFVSSDLPRKNTDQIVHFDMLPTILDFRVFFLAWCRV